MNGDYRMYNPSNTAATNQSFELHPKMQVSRHFMDSQTQSRLISADNRRHTCARRPSVFKSQNFSST